MHYNSYNNLRNNGNMTIQELLVKNLKVSFSTSEKELVAVRGILVVLGYGTFLHVLTKLILSGAGQGEARIIPIMRTCIFLCEYYADKQNKNKTPSVCKSNMVHEAKYR